MNAALPETTNLQTFPVEIGAEGLFDMDGVLVCSTGGDERCWLRWAEHHKLHLDIRRTHGRRAADTLREHLPTRTAKPSKRISPSSTRSRPRNKRALWRIPA